MGLSSLRLALAALSLLLAGQSKLGAQRYSWREVDAGVRPPAREFAAMVFDAARGVSILFGGRAENPGRFLNDLWAFDGVSWTELHPAHSPSPRVAMAMAYDPIRERVVLFGGSTFSGARPLDTWEWDGTDWQQVGGVNAFVRDGGVACYDPTVGGILYTQTDANLLWDGVSWRSLRIGPPSNGRNWYGMVFLPSLGGAIGCGLDLATFRFDNQFLWTPVLNPPGPQVYNFALAADPIAGRMVAVGGNDSSFGGSLTWICEGSGWFRLGEVVPPRHRASMTFDSRRQRFVLFGGEATSTPVRFYRNDTWELSAYDDVASYTSFGRGCDQSAAQLDAEVSLGGRPILGGVMTMLGTGLSPHQPYLHCIGGSDTHWLGQSLPWDLGAIGAPSCSLLVAPEILEVAGTSDAMGRLRFAFRIPNELQLSGAPYFDQLIGLAPGNNAAGLLLTNGGAGILGVR